MIPISGLWIGPQLSSMEQLSILSFLDKGYTYNLYTYGNVKNIPPKVIVKDANEILPESELFTYKNKSYSAVSNLFRFILLYKKNTVWVDLDIICTKNYNFEKDKYLFVTEPDKLYKVEKLGSCLIRMPQNDIICYDAIQKCRREKKKILNGEIVWGTGPKTIKYIVNKYALHKYVKKWNFSNCCSNKHYECIINNNFNEKGQYFNTIDKIPNSNYFIHLWNEYLRRSNFDKDNIKEKTFLYELTKKLIPNLIPNSNDD